ncbi:MAG: hypothetical protein V3U04_00975 [Candidatus Aerophobetes bacterium]
MRIFGVEKADAFPAPVYYQLSHYIPISLLGLYNLGRFGLRVGDITREAVQEKNTIRPKRPEDLAKLMIEKELITQAEFMNKLAAEETGYRAIFQRMK